jgi:ketosteroid isomerase-like protein
MSASHADVVEGVRATLHTYVQALDDGRTDDIVATFVPDGVFDSAAVGRFEGHDALRAAYDSWTPTRPQRHLVLNTVLTSWTGDSAEAVSDVVFLLKASDGWATLLVGRYHDTLRYEDDAWRFVERVATFLD